MWASLPRRRGLSSCIVWAELSGSLWGFNSLTRIKPMLPALEGRFLTIGQPGKSSFCLFFTVYYSFSLFGYFLMLKKIFQVVLLSHFLNIPYHVCYFFIICFTLPFISSAHFFKLFIQAISLRDSVYCQLNPITPVSPSSLIALSVTNQKRKVVLICFKTLFHFFINNFLSRDFFSSSGAP